MIQVIISLQGGNVELESYPDNVHIILHDYDIDGTIEEGREYGNDDCGDYEVIEL